jgi:glutaconyl-CoA/methylmalonyl-CoA decarboxylase subunit gamma
MKRLRITLEGKSYELSVEVLNESGSPVSAPPVAPIDAQSKTVLSTPATAAPTVAAQPVASGVTTVFCPMAGVVFKCPVKPGDVVAVNQPVIILEAMKMETSVHSPVAGAVRSVLVKEGDAVEEGQPLVLIDGGAQ